MLEEAITTAQVGLSISPRTGGIYPTQGVLGYLPHWGRLGYVLVPTEDGLHWAVAASDCPGMSQTRLPEMFLSEQNTEHAQSGLLRNLIDVFLRWLVAKSRIEVLQNRALLGSCDHPRWPRASSEWDRDRPGRRIRRRPCPCRHAVRKSREDHGDGPGVDDVCEEGEESNEESG